MQPQKKYAVHPISAQSANNLARAYRRHGVDIEIPTYVERRLKKGKLELRHKQVAPGYAMLPVECTVNPEAINQQEGRHIIRASIGTMTDRELSGMQQLPPVDLVPKQKKFKAGDHIMIKGVELTGRVKHLTGTEAVVVLDQTFLGSQRVCKVAFDNLEYYQHKPGS
ncbi:MAG: hypothetical protein K2X00_10865 [Nitrospiraceae bacterium]|nr:hypothetical protein [Nitrospiraceae bacterium]